MSNYQSDRKKVFNNKKTSLTQKPQAKLLANTSFQLQRQKQSVLESQFQQVLTKVSQMVANLHASLIPKTQNVQVYRELSEQDQMILEKAKNDSLLHTISAGVMAIDSCIKHISKQENYWSGMVMKSLTVCLGNYHKLRQNLPQIFNQGKMVKFQDSLQLVVSEIQKIPAARIKSAQIQRQKQLLNTICQKKQSEILHSKEENLLFSLLANQNTSFGKRIQTLEIQNNNLSKQIEFLRSGQSTVSLSGKKFKCQTAQQSDPYINETSSNASSKTIEDLNMQVRKLQQQLEANQRIIAKMNKEFSVEIQKYQKVFKQLEEQNQLLKQYSDIDTVRILQELQYELDRMKMQKRKDQAIISRVIDEMEHLSFYAQRQKTYSWNQYRSQNPTFFNRLNRQGTRNYERSKSRSPSHVSNKKARDQITLPQSEFLLSEQRQKLPTGSYYRQQYTSQQSESPCFGVGKYDNLETEKNIRIPNMSSRQPILSPRSRQLHRTRTQSTFFDRRKNQNAQKSEEENTTKNLMRKSKILKQSNFGQFEHI